MKKEQFLNDIQSNCSEILHLSTKHMLDKLYKDDEELDKIKLTEFFTNYKNYHLYLNDFAATIYSRYASSVNNLYIEMCEYLDVEVDNKYTLEHVIIKLEKQTPELLLSLTSEDIQKQTIIHFDEKLEAIESSAHYNNNLDEFKERVDKLKQNIYLVKNALQIS
ncbi:MAG: hypothetical protein U9Q04_08230 [Campylobacterota bacterium]|nr:hypothetical protein [Campylobacterota bacterium]